MKTAAYVIVTIAAVVFILQAVIGWNDQREAATKADHDAAWKVINEELGKAGY